MQSPNNENVVFYAVAIAVVFFLRYRLRSSTRETAVAKKKFAFMFLLVTTDVLFLFCVIQLIRWFQTAHA